MSSRVHKLESEKYLTNSLKEERKLARRQANATAEQTILDCCLFVLAIAAGFYIYQSMPVWMPVVENYFHQLTHFRYA